jgi:ABC-type uncharacterized transport system substrate-binding protein
MRPQNRHNRSAHRRPGAGVARAWRVGVLGLLLWLIAPLVAGETRPDRPIQIQILLSETGGSYTELVESLEQQLNARAPGHVRLQAHRVPEGTTQLDTLLATLSSERPALIVPVGMRATTLALRGAGTVPVLSLLIPFDSYTTLLNTLPEVAGQALPSRSAIYLDQPLRRQLDLLHVLMPGVRHIAALTGPASQARIGELQALCAQRDLRLSTQSVAAGSNPVQALTPLLEQAEALLALPDPAVFNRASLQAILLTTYRGGVPVLGFSQAYVRAGALAAVHSTARQIGQQAGEWLAELAHSGQWQLGTPRYPAYYSVSVNRQVAQTLGIRVADEDTLLAQLRKKDRQDDIHEP